MSNREKSIALGMNYSTASNRLRKMIMWKFVVDTGQDVCFRCSSKIELISDLSIEHKDEWQQATNPRESFFDLDNIAFSHLTCNIRAAQSYNGQKEYCPLGHPYDAVNTYVDTQDRRKCRKCHRERNKTWMADSRKSG